MKKYVCTICGYIYDEAAGHPESSVSPGTKWEDVPGDWLCPLCGAGKESFEEKPESTQATNNEIITEETSIETKGDLSPKELSAVFSNLSKGCDKQYLPKEADLFNQLSKYFNQKAIPITNKDFNDIQLVVQQDINALNPIAKKTATGASDRGALRALVWEDKVTKMGNSILTRYEKEQDALLENTNVFVCEICGFIYVGDEAPDVCPVCKVPKIKLTKIERGA